MSVGNDEIPVVARWLLVTCGDGVVDISFLYFIESNDDDILGRTLEYK